MKKAMRRIVPLVLVVLNVSISLAAAASLTASPAGTGAFVLTGNGFSGVNAIDITIIYDTATMENVSVVRGSLLGSAMMMANPNLPGSVRIAVINIQPINGTGPVATVNFAQKTGSGGKLLSLRAFLTDEKYRTYEIPTEFFNPTAPAADATGAQEGSEGHDTAEISGQGTTTTSPAAGSAGGTSPGIVGGSVTMSAEGEAKEKSLGEPALPVQEPEQAKEKPEVTPAENTDAPDEAVSGKPALPAAEKFEPITSVLEKFRTHRGGQDPKDFISLFSPAVEKIRQEPSVVLSDGVMKARIYFARAGSGAEPPSFALKGAKLVSLGMEGTATYVLEILPQKGVYQATVLVIHDGSKTEIPLTVAPPLPAGSRIGRGEKMTEADFTRFLKERGSENAPVHDLNGDGRRDYIDDYIFTANYIVSSDPRVKGKKK